MDNSEQYTSFIRVRLSASDAHYGAVNWSMGHICFLYLAMLLLNLLFCVMVMRACLWVTNKLNFWLLCLQGIM